MLYHSRRNDRDRDCECDRGIRHITELWDLCQSRDFGDEPWFTTPVQHKVTLVDCSLFQPSRWQWSHFISRPTINHAVFVCTWNSLCSASAAMCVWILRHRMSSPVTRPPRAPRLSAATSSDTEIAGASFRQLNAAQDDHQTVVGPALATTISTPSTNAQLHATSSASYAISKSPTPSKCILGNTGR